MSMCKVFILSHIKKEKVLLSVWTLISGTQHENCTKDDKKQCCLCINLASNSIFFKFAIDSATYYHKMVARNEISVSRRGKGKSWGMLHEVLYKCLSHFNFVQVYRNILACYITTKLTCRLPN